MSDFEETYAKVEKRQPAARRRLDAVASRRRRRRRGTMAEDDLLVAARYAELDATALASIQATQKTTTDAGGG